MKIGFSSGCLYKTHERMLLGTFAVFRNAGANALEIMWHESNLEDDISKIEKDDLAGFDYVSLHLPTMELLSEVQIVEILQKVFDAHQKLHFDCVVLHPYSTIKWEVFQQFDLPYAIENMDWRKDFGKYVDSLQEIFSKFDVPMVLDLNHCYTNDPSMRLAADMIESFGSRIKEIHLSGFEVSHEPLFKTKQVEILQYVFDKNIPIIIESGLENEEEVGKELEYVKKQLNDKK